MAGFNGITGDETIMYADNASFNGNERTGKLSADKQIFLGSSTAGTKIKRGTIVAGAGVTITQTDTSLTEANLTFALTGGAVATEHLTGNDGVLVSPDGSNNINVFGNGVSASGISTAGNTFVTGVGSTLTINDTKARFATNYTTTNHAASPYVVLSTDYYISVDTTDTVQINLPNAPTTNRLFIIKDKTGNASAKNISITTVGGVVTIDGQTTYTIDSNYASIQLLFNGTSYEVY